MRISSIWTLILEYSTFGGETNFTKSVGSAVFGLMITVVTLQLALLRVGISEPGLALVSAIFTVLFPVGILYYTIKSAKRTTETKFHSRKGQAKVIATYLSIGGLSVLLLHTIAVTVITDVRFFDLAISEVMLGIALSLGFGFVTTIANYSALSDTYPSLQKVLTRFQTESSEKLDGVENEIKGIGHVPRSETSRILQAIQENGSLDNIIVRGQGGVGKSGVLKRVTEQCEYEILFIDVSAYSVIRSESDLAEELDLEISLERAIQQVSANRPLVVIFDQLDDTDRESGEIYSDLIFSISQIDGVSTIFACRTYELKNYNEFSTLSDSEHFDIEVEVTSLSESKVREYLEEIGIDSPSNDLVELCEDIEYLDVVGRLADSGADLENITTQVTVWEEYRDLLSEEDHPSDDRLRGSRVVDRAVEHAIATTESGNSVFSISDLLWTDEQLISMGVIQRVSSSGRERVFRFRHQQFQLYLYAWDRVNETVDDDDLFRETIEELDDDINYDVLKWMFAVYTANEADLPDGTDEFLEEILGDDGFSFYWASKILDVVKRWDASENQAVTRTVLDKLETREDLYNYFFDEETDPSWAQALADSGRFQAPPPHLLNYLYQIASQHPEIVQRIIRNDIGNLDQRDQTSIVSTIQELPIERGADLIDIVKEWLSRSEPALDLYYSRSAEFAEELIDKEYFDEGLGLVDSLLTVRLQAEAEDGNDVTMGSYYLNSLFDEGTLDRLIENRPDQTIELFEEQLQDATQHRANERDGEIDDLQFFYLHSVSNYKIENDNRNQPFELFLGFLREALDIWFENPSTDDQRHKIREYLDGNVVFRAFGFYLLRTHSDEHPDLVAEELLTEQNYSDTRLKKEFKLLLKHGFGSLSQEQQQDVIDLISSVPVEDSLKQTAENQIEHFEDMTVDEVVEQESSRWIRDRLWPIKEELPEETRSRLDELVGRFKDEPADPEDSPVQGGFVAYESPEPASDLRDRSPSELINFCIKEPFEEQEQYNRSSVDEIGRRGAAEQVADIILDEPDKYAPEIPRLAEADDSYFAELVGHMRDRMEEEPGILESTRFRQALWKLSKEVVSNPDDWSSHIRKRIGWLLRDGLGDRELYEYFLQEEDEVRELIFLLLDDPDPDLERDRPPEGYAGHNNPSHNALNTVRPVALDALIIYIRRKSDEEDTGLDSEMAEKLGEMLDDPSLGVRSVFGRRFVQLWTIDQDWTIGHLPEIFPRSQSRRDIEKFTAAWDSYVAFNQSYREIFPELRKYYFHNIDLMAEDESTDTMNVEQGMAGHLLANYLYEYDLEDWPDSLLAYLYDRGDQDSARQVAWVLWKWGDNQEEDDVFENWGKARNLWEKRLDQVGDDETYSEEMSWFIRWLEYIKNNVELPEVEGLLRKSVVHIANNRRSWMTIEEYLSNQSDRHPEMAVDILHSLTTEFEPPVREGFTEEITSILRPAFEGFEHGDEVYDKAFEIAETYASKNDQQAQKFIDENR